MSETAAALKSACAAPIHREMPLTVDVRRARSALVPRPPTVVLMYHRVADPRHDPFALCVSPEHFAQQLAVIRERARPIRLGDCLADGPTDRPRVAITFDDGYLDVLTDALPTLEANDCPATLFVVSDAIGAPCEFWWDELEQIFRTGWDGERPVELVWGAGRVAGRLTADEAALRTIHGVLINLPPEGIRVLLDDLREQLEVGAATLERRAMTGEELARLDDSELIELGAHTRRHPNLTVLSGDALRDEIAGSRAALQERVGRPLDHFSYPYGGHDAGTVACARDSGVSLACTVSPGLVGADTDPLRVPRCNVEDWDGDRFEHELERWLAAA